MNWKTYFLRFLRNVVLGIVFSVVVLGVFGYLLGGKDGLVNMAYWGIALGVIGGFFSGIGVLFEADFWGKGNYKIFPDWNWFIKKSDDQGRESDH